MCGLRADGRPAWARSRQEKSMSNTAQKRQRVLGLAALAVSYGAIALLVRERGATLATIAALAGGLGAFCGAIVNVFAYPVLAATASAPVSASSAAQVLVTAANSRFVETFEGLYF